MKTKICLYILVFLTIGSAWAAVPNIRPENKKFVSDAVEAYLNKHVPEFSDQDLAQLFKNTFTYTLDNTVFNTNVDQDNDLVDLKTFIVTGDIKAMWIRDSTNQLSPLAFLIPVDQRLFRLFTGLLNTQSAFLQEDPFANAFVVPGGDSSPHNNDQTYGQFNSTKMTGSVFERKFEPDSLAAFMKLQRIFFTASTDQQKSELFKTRPDWVDTTRSLVDLLWNWAGSTSLLWDPGSKYYYYFVRPNAGTLDTLENGVGKPEKVTGMVRTVFRPSDDASTYPFNIPVNFMLAYELSSLAGIYQQLSLADETLTTSMISLSKQILTAIHTYGLKSDKSNCQYNFEVDGNGNEFFIDDGNYPSLLSMPMSIPGFYSQACYQNTRPFILASSTNSFFFPGQNGVKGGVGSPHTGLNHVWPLALISQARTTSDANEKTQLINALVASSGTTGLIHESYLNSNYSDFTRSDFAWGNAAFSELILETLHRQPELLLKHQGL